MKRGGPDHPKTRELAIVLNLKRWEVTGLLEALWHFTAAYAKRGDIGRWTDQQIAAALEWDRTSPEELIDALVRCKFLDQCKTHRLVVHDWQTHADQTVRRSQEVKEQGFASITPSNPSRMLANASAPLANASQPEPEPEPMPEPCAASAACGEPRSEASTPAAEDPPEEPEEADRAQGDPSDPPRPACGPSDAGGSDGNPADPRRRRHPPASPSGADPPEAGKPPSDDAPAMTFVTKGSRDWSLTQAKCDEYRESYPQIDVDAEFRAARQWLVDNPDRRKTARGMAAFLTGWLNRARNGNGRRNNGHDPPGELVQCGPIDENVYLAAVAAEKSEGRS